MFLMSGPGGNRCDWCERMKSTTHQVASRMSQMRGRRSMSCRKRNAGELLLQLILHALTEPLLDHALVVQVAAAGDALDAAEHAGIEPQGDGRALPHVGPVHGADHEPGIELVFRPEFGLVLLALERQHLSPASDGFHGDIWVGRRAGLEVLGLLALVKVIFLRGHQAAENHPVPFPVRPEDAENAPSGKRLSEGKVAGGTRIRTLAIRQELEGEGILERLLDVLWGKRGEVERNVYPVKLHAVGGRGCGGRLIN